MKYCPNCGKSEVEGMKFCPSCGTKLVQEAVIQSGIKPETEPSVEPGVNQGVQPKSRSAALKWGTGILFVLTAILLISMISLIDLIRQGFALSVFGDFIVFPLALVAAIYAVKRKHWGFVVGVTIWLPISTIIGLLIIYGGGVLGFVLPGDIVWAVFLLLLEITCLILISRTKAEFS